LLDSETEESEYEGDEANEEIEKAKKVGIRSWSISSLKGNGNDTSARTDSVDTSRSKSVISEGGTTKKGGDKKKGIVLSGAKITAYATSIF